IMLLPLLLPALSALASAVEVKRPRGVSLTNHHFYEESKPFTCLDGSSTIAFEWVNDDYCDCQDGSDEPGTSACPNGRFHCTNAGYRPQYIPSSRVNDGVCDCCDATDEYNSGFVCENTCKEMGRKEREALAQMAEVAREGFQLKQVLIEEASKGREDKQVRRSGSRGPGPCAGDTSRLCGWSHTEQKAAEKAAREQARASEAFQELDDDGDGLVSVAELQTHVELDVDGDGTLSETEAQGAALQAGQEAAGCWACMKAAWQVPRWLLTGHANLLLPPTGQPGIEWAAASVPQLSCRGRSRRRCAEDTIGKAAWPSPAPGLTSLPSLPAAQKAREQFEEAEKSVKEMEDSIQSLEKEISFDFGPQGEFVPVIGLIPPSRPQTVNFHWGVKLTCGKETVVTSTTEPSRCEYLMELVTPAACQEPRDPGAADHDEL
uniref:Glucosidase 2 subunit beta n=1 Tax=Chelonoidis abingdonii TaxID=106734 RepID=A0A8C0GAG1_CHEAB